MYKNKKIALLVAFSLVVSMFASCVQVFAEQLYIDVNENHWAYQWVRFMKANDYISGYPNGSYLPGNNITRAEFVTILNKVKNASATAENVFTDNHEGDWYYNIINTAVGSGYLTGYGDGTVRPNGFITREEAAVVIAKAYNVRLGTDVSYTDKADISAWALPYVAALTDYEILSGYEDNSFKPQANMLRAEMAALIYAIENKPVVTIEPTPYAKLPETLAQDTTDTGSYNLGNIEAGNTADQLKLDIIIEENTAGDLTVTYTKDGEEHTVTVDELKDVVFTKDELAAAGFKLNFANPSTTSTAKITVKVTDNGTELVSKTYDISFGTEPSPTPTTTPGGGLIGGGGSRPTPTPTPTPTPKPPFEERDRVVESLEGYQTENYNVLDGDDSTKYLTDMLAVILSNDGNKEFDTTGSQTAFAEDAQDVLDEIIDADKFDTLRDINENVIQYVVVKMPSFAGATIETANKKEYVLYFRAMVNVIDQAAETAIEVYGDDRYVGADAKFREFSEIRVPQIVANMFANYPELTDDTMKNNIKIEAVNYCTKLFNKGQQAQDNIRDQLAAAAADGLTYEEFIGILEQYLLTKAEMQN